MILIIKELQEFYESEKIWYICKEKFEKKQLKN